MLLSWDPPILNGGSDILGYFVEAIEQTLPEASLEDEDCCNVSDSEDDRESSNGWEKVSGPKILIDYDFNVIGLKEGTNYLFRVAAVNKVGTGAYITLR